MAHDYIFFDDPLRERFVRFAAERGLACATRADRMEGQIVSLPESVDDGLLHAMEAEYDLLMDEQRELADAEDDAQARDLMGITVTLPDGRPCQVRLPPLYGRRLIAHFSAQEIHDLVSLIAQQVANPQSGPLCRSL